MDSVPGRGFETQWGLITPPSSPLKGQAYSMEREPYVHHDGRTDYALDRTCDIANHSSLVDARRYGEHGIHIRHNQVHRASDYTILALTPPASPTKQINTPSWADNDKQYGKVDKAFKLGRIWSEQAVSITPCFKPQLDGTDESVQSAEERRMSQSIGDDLGNEDCAESQSKQVQPSTEEASQACNSQVAGVPTNQGSNAAHTDKSASSVRSSVSTDKDPFFCTEKRPGLLSRISSRRRHPCPIPDMTLSSCGSSPIRDRSSSGSPDRFVPTRRPTAVTRDNFQLSKAVHKLTYNEKATRQQSYGPDPFSTQIRRAVPVTSNHPSHRSPGGASTDRAPHGSSSGLMGLPSTSLRQVSNGAVWNVGGPEIVLNSVSGVPNGQGGMLARGTNAPLYRSNFSRSDPESSVDAHERRLALAIDVDQTCRMLGPLTSSERIDRGHGNHQIEHIRGIPSSQSSVGPTVWRDNEWAKAGSVYRESNNIFFCNCLLNSDAGSRSSAKAKKAVPVVPFR